MSDSERTKKIDGIGWKAIAFEGLTALAAGRSDASVSLNDLYLWIESSEYLTDYGRLPDAGWSESNPSYRASFQLCLQRMVGRGELRRVRDGIYCLAADTTYSTPTLWERLVEADARLVAPVVRQQTVARIQRSQTLRDGLINYYASRCQICGDDAGSPFRIPMESAGRFYVEVHHVNGLAETVARQNNGVSVGFRVNGIGNLVVLCPHHHAMVHWHYPRFEFDRTEGAWQNAGGATLRLYTITPEHRDTIRLAACQ